MVKFAQAALIVSRDELAVIDLLTKAKLGSFGGDVPNSPASIVISNYCGRGYQGILNPPTFANVQGDRAMLNVWSWMRSKPISKFVLPERLTSLAVSGSGEFFVGGGASGKIYTWETNSDLLQTINSHTGATKVIKFTTDDNYILTGGEDGLVLAWPLQACTDPGRDPNTITPYRVFSGHSLEITDLCLSTTLYQHTLLFTTSLDSQCKIWNFLTGDLLSTISMPSPITSSICDSATTQIIIGCENGVIYFTSLTSNPHSESAPLKVDDGLPQFIQAHKSKVSCLELSLDGALFASGSEDGKVIFWDINTRVQVFGVELNSGPVYKVLAILRPPTPAQQRFSALKCGALEWVPWKIRKDTVESQRVLETHERCYTRSQTFTPTSSYSMYDGNEQADFLSVNNYAAQTENDQVHQESNLPKSSSVNLSAEKVTSTDKISNYGKAVSDFMREIESSSEK